MISFLLDNIWLILFVASGLALLNYRGKFRKIVYQTDSWLINIKPVFANELRGIIGNLCVEHYKYKKYRDYYRGFLVFFVVLLVFYFDFSGFTQTEPTAGKKEKIGVGSTLPSFSLRDQDGKLFVSDSIVGKYYVVLFFYNNDNSPNSLREVWAFRDNLNDFKAVGAKVIGIGKESVSSHKQFSTENDLFFPLLSDEGNKIRKLFRVPSNMLGYMPGRVTYIVDKTGKVIYVHSSQVRTYKHATNALRFLENMK